MTHAYELMFPDFCFKLCKLVHLWFTFITSGIVVTTVCDHFIFNGPRIAYILIITQQEATIYSLFMSANRSTCFRWWYHPKHVEQFSDINKMYIVASCWVIIDTNWWPFCGSVITVVRLYLWLWCFQSLPNRLSWLGYNKLKKLSKNVNIWSTLCFMIC